MNQTKRVALVTGAARGIGRAIATDLATDHRVAITHLKTDPGPLLSDVPNIRAFQSDLSDPTAPATLVEQVLADLGPPDLVVLNAGAIETDDSDRAGMNVEVNLHANHRLLAALRPHLASGAAIVAISSVNSRLPAMGAALYSASKAALETWVKGMAKTLGPDGIRVVAVAPGAIEIPEEPRNPALVTHFTELTALGRLAQPRDIARAVRFLGSDDASAITGTVLEVSGGYRL